METRRTCKTCDYYDPVMNTCSNPRAMHAREVDLRTIKFCGNWKEKKLFESDYTEEELYGKGEQET